MSLLLALVAPALAAAPECPAPYTNANLAEDLRVVQSALRALDDAAFDAAGRRLDAGLACLDAPLPPLVFAAIYRYVGAWYWIIPGNSSVAERWFRASLELDPDYAWDVEELDPQSSMRDAWDAQRAALSTEPVVVSGKELATGVLVDGRPWTATGTSPGRPHVVQRVEGGVVTTWKVDGPLLPESLLADPAPVVAEEPSRRRGKDRDEVAPAPTAATSGFDVLTVERQRPPAKTPLLLAGGVGMLAAGGVYGLALVSRGAFDAADTSAEVESLRARTNALVLASGGTLVLGVGLGGWGALLEGGGVIGLRAPF